MLDWNDHWMLQTKTKNTKPVGSLWQMRMLFFIVNIKWTFNDICYRKTVCSSSLSPFLSHTLNLLEAYDKSVWIFTVHFKWTCHDASNKVMVSPKIDYTCNSQKITTISVNINNTFYIYTKKYISQGKQSTSS